MRQCVKRLLQADAWQSPAASADAGLSVCAHMHACTRCILCTILGERSISATDAWPAVCVALLIGGVRVFSLRTGTSARWRAAGSVELLSVASSFVCRVAFLRVGRERRGVSRHTHQADRKGMRVLAAASRSQAGVFLLFLSLSQACHAGIKPNGASRAWLRTVATVGLWGCDACLAVPDAATNLSECAAACQKVAVRDGPHGTRR
eukprot:351308-Chlamydomonas_euryale.AAC.2